MRALIMAGGRGTRMGALTEHTAKPMLPVHGKPIFHHVYDTIRGSKISTDGKNSDVYIAINAHYMTDKFYRYIADEQLDIKILTENEPLGTAGALRLLPDDIEPENTLVINGDVLCDCPLDGMVDKHRQHDNDITLAVHNYSHRVPYGVIEETHGGVMRIVEKPTYSWGISTGIYILGNRVVIPPGHVDMPDLVNDQIAKGNRVGFFYLWGDWQSIETPEDLRRANELG